MAYVYGFGADQYVDQEYMRPSSPASIPTAVSPDQFVDRTYLEQHFPVAAPGGGAWKWLAIGAAALGAFALLRMRR